MMKQDTIKCECGNEFYFQSIRDYIPCMACGRMHPNEGAPVEELTEEKENE